MSYTTMYAVPKSGPTEEVAEFGNSWGAAMRVWNALIYRYLVPVYLTGMDRDAFIGRIMMSEFKELWPLAKSARLSREERLTLAATYDRVICEIERCNELADAFDAFNKLYPVEGVNHLPAMAAAIRQWHGREGYVGLCWRQTSVSDNLWWVPSEDDEDESRPFDFSIDTEHGHWMLFEESDSTELVS